MRISDWSSDVCSSDLIPGTASRSISLRKCVCADSEISIIALLPACCRRLARPLAARIRKLPAVERILAALPIRVRSGSVKPGRPPFLVQHAAIAAAPTGADLSDLIPLAQAHCMPRQGSEPKRSEEQHTSELQSLMRI